MAEIIIIDHFSKPHLSKMVQTCFFQGIERVYDVMPEIVIDVPAAYTILERFVMRCKTAGMLTDELVRKMPSRGRKRFVSEGDGGLIKEGFW